MCVNHLLFKKLISQTWFFPKDGLYLLGLLNCSMSVLFTWGVTNWPTTSYINQRAYEGLSSF